MDSTNANDAATIVNAVVEAYKSYQSEQHQLTGVQVMKILQDDIQHQEEDLKQEQQQLTTFKKENPDLILDTADKAKSPAAAMMGQLTDAHTKTVNFRIAVEEATNFTDDAVQLKRIVDETNAATNLPPDTEPVVDPLTMDSIRQTENQLRAYVTAPNNPTAQSLLETKKQNYLERSREMAESARRYLTYLNKQLEANQQRESELKKEVDANRVEAIESNSKDAEYDQMTAQIDETRRALDAQYNRMRTVDTRSDVGSFSVAVLEPAKPSTDTIGTKRSNALGMAIVAGLMVGLGASLLLEMVDSRLRSVEEVSRLLTTPVLGAVPHIMAGLGWVIPYSFHDFRINWRKYTKSAWGNFGRRKWRTTQTLMQCGQSMHLQPRSDVAEAYRAIRTAIYFGMSGYPAKTILITSPASGDGKTTLASNLAIAIAQTGRSVLLIDADCWRPAQQEIFGLTEESGLTDVLQKKKSLAEAVHKTDVVNLEILPCGDLPLNPAELLESQAFSDMLAIASEKYDQILVDSPPVVPITDARILAATCDATILVLRAGKSTRHQADSAFEALNAVGAPILGVVVNDAPRQAHGSSYQYYHYAAGRNSSDWDQYTPAEIGERRNGNGHHGNGNGNGNGYARHFPADMIIDADEEIETE